MRRILTAITTLLLQVAPAVATEPTFRGDDKKPMTITLGRFASSPDCGPRCADFIVARGEIAGFEYMKLLVAHAKAGSRPLPLILHSPGGNLETARAMGDILAKLGLTVAIAKAWPLPCADGKLCLSDEVKPYRLEAARAGCASACALAIAGAVRRIVPQGAAVGVHMPRSPQDNRESDRETREFAEDIAVRKMRFYYTRYGFAPGVVDLIRTTPSSEMRWLTREELRELGFIDDGPQSLPAPAPLELAPGNASRQRP